MNFIMEYMPHLIDVNNYFDARLNVSDTEWGNLKGNINFELFSPVENYDGVEVIGSESSYGKFSKEWSVGESRTWYFIFKNKSSNYVNWKTIIGNEDSQYKCSTISMDSNGYLKFTRPDIIPDTNLGYTCQDWHVVAWVSNGITNTTKLWIDGTYINSVSNMEGWATDTYLARGSTWFYEDNNTVFRGIMIADSAHDDAIVVENSLWLYDYYINKYDNKVIYTEVINFNEGWENQRPEVFSVVNSTVPFYVNSTFKYNNRSTWRSGNINHGGTTESTINFTLIQNGGIELTNIVSSENNYDILRIYIDNVEVVSKSGSWAWKIYYKSLDAGDHTLKVKYSKDSSASGGSDAGAIGQIKFIGALKPYARKYLIQDDNNYYTIVNESLSIIENAELNSDLFLNYGLSYQPNNIYLMQLVNPKLLFWHDSSDELPKIKISVAGTPPIPQTVITNTQDMSDSTILGIEGIQAVCSDDILFALSFDDEVTWKAYDGTTWIILDLPNTGMTKTTMESIGLEAWAEVVTSDHYKVRFILPTTTSYMTSMVVNYIN